MVGGTQFPSLKLGGLGTTDLEDVSGCYETVNSLSNAFQPHTFDGERK